MKPADILYHITVACKPGELVETTRGQVTYQQWCEEEMARIARKGNWSDSKGNVPVAIYVNDKTGEISLVHLRVQKKA